MTESQNSQTERGNIFHKIAVSAEALDSLCVNMTVSILHHTNFDRIPGSMLRRIVGLVAKLCCGISGSDGANTSDSRSRLASRGSRLIHPTSIFYVNEQFVLALLLFYTAINTPFTVAFYWAQGACDAMPTLPFDMFVDCYFLMDIVMTFFVGIWLEGKYVDEHRVVAWTYAKGSFCFDFFTSFPVSFLEKIVLDQCMAEVAGPESEQGLDTAAVRMLRVIKPLRLFKLFRILKGIGCMSKALSLSLSHTHTHTTHNTHCKPFERSKCLAFLPYDLRPLSLVLMFWILACVVFNLSCSNAKNCRCFGRVLPYSA